MNQDEMQHEFNKLKEQFGDIHDLRFVVGQWTETMPDLDWKNRDASAEMVVLVSLGSWNGQTDERDARIFYYTDGDPIKRGDTICDGDFFITHIPFQWAQEAMATWQN